MTSLLSICRSGSRSRVRRSRCCWEPSGPGRSSSRAAQSPRKALRSARLRLTLLLVACFALPVLAVMLPGGNIYNGWRQMYFLWTPFALLAALGLRGLSGALGGRVRIAVYGAAGAGFAATVISMALIHPNEDVYFTFFVDRVAPGASAFAIHDGLLGSYDPAGARMASHAFGAIFGRAVPPLFRIAITGFWRTRWFCRSPRESAWPTPLRSASLAALPRCHGIAPPANCIVWKSTGTR